MSEESINKELDEMLDGEKSSQDELSAEQEASSTEEAIFATATTLLRLINDLKVPSRSADIKRMRHYTQQVLDIITF